MTTGVGYFEVAINGQYFEKDWVRGWSMLQYANFFKSAIDTAMPELTTSVDAVTAELTVTTAAGAPLEILVHSYPGTGEYAPEGTPTSRYGQFELVYAGKVYSVPWTSYQQNLHVLGSQFSAQIKETLGDLFTITEEIGDLWAYDKNWRWTPRRLVIWGLNGVVDTALVTLRFFPSGAGKPVDGKVELEVASSEAQLPVPVFVVVKNGVPEQTYEISLNGTRVSYTTGASDAPASYRQSTIANALAAQVNALGGYTAEVYYSVVLIKQNAGLDIKFDVFDTWGSQGLYAMKGRVSAISDLPGRFLDGYPVEVAGTEGDAGGYYLQWTHAVNGKDAEKGSLKKYVERAYARRLTVFEAQIVPAPGAVGVAWTAQESSENGIYKEARKGFIAHTIVPETMPHALVREADGTFTFKLLDWADRKVGDEKSCPRPSFIGRQISDMFFYKNRFGLLTNESVLLSRAGEYFNFWPATAKDVLDSDPIDVLVSSTEVSILRYAVPFDDKLLLFSDRLQYAVTSAGPLTPRTINVQPSTSFQCSPMAKPVPVGQNVFFTGERSGYAQVREYFVQTNSTQSTADDTTAHCPAYVAGDVYRLAASETESILLALSDRDPSAIFVYKYLWDGDTKVQNSWSRWSVKGGTVLSLSFIGSKVYAAVQRADGVYQEVMDLKSLTQEGMMQYSVLLDRRVEVKGVYSGGVTTFTLPYVDARVPTFVKSFGMSPPGAALALTKAGPAAYTVVGDLGGQQVTAGFGYEMRYRFSPMFVRDSKGQSVVTAKLKLRTIAVAYANTGAFRWEITPLLRTTAVKRFTADVPGVATGAPELATLGVFRTQVMSDASSVKMELVHDAYTPCQFQNVTWEGVYTARA